MSDLDIGTLVASLKVDDSGMDFKGALEKIKGFGGEGGKAAKIAGVAIAAGLAASIGAAISVEPARKKLAAQMRLTPAEQKTIGDSATDLFKGGFTDGIEQSNEVLRAVISNFKDMRTASSAELTEVGKKASVTANLMGEDFDTVTRVAGQLVKDGLAKNASEAFDLITAASQNTSADMQGDLLEVASEYSKHFANLGINGSEALKLISDASADGAISMDKAGDALKEMSIRATDMSTTSVASYQAAGLNAKEMSDKILRGGDDAREGLDQIVNGLLAIEDPTARANAAIGLFGTPLEDLGVDKIPAFLKSLRDMDGGLGDVAGRTQEAGQIMSDTATGNLSSLWKSIQSIAIETGEHLLPYLAPVVDGIGWIAGVAGDAAKAIGSMISPVTLIGAGLIALVALGPKLLTFLTALPAKAKAAAAGINAAMGPIGWLLTGITVAWGLFSSAFSDDANVPARTADIDALTATLDKNTGAITDNTRATFIKDAQDKGILDRLGKLGIDTKTYTDAVLGNESAQKKLNAALDPKKHELVGAAVKNMSQDLKDAGITAEEYAAALNSGDYSTVEAKIRRFAGTGSEAQAKMNALFRDMQAGRASIEDLTIVTDYASSATTGFATEQEKAAQRAKAMGDAANEAADGSRKTAEATQAAADASKAAAAAAKEKADADAEAQARGEARSAVEQEIAERTKKNADEQQRLADKLQAAKDQLTPFAKNSQVAADKQQALASQADRVNDELDRQKGILPSVDGAIADVNESLDGMADAFGLGTDKAISAKKALDETTGGMDLTTEAGRTLYEQTIKVRDGAVKMATAQYGQTLATKGQAAADRELRTTTENVRKEFIQNLTKIPGMTEKMATKIADDYGLIPKDVETAIKADNAQAKAKAAEVEKKQKELDRSKSTVNLDADSDPALVKMRNLKGMRIPDKSFKIGADISLVYQAIQRANNAIVRNGGTVAHSSITVARALGGMIPGLAGGGFSGMLPGPGAPWGVDNLLGLVNGMPVGLAGLEFVVNPRATAANRTLLEMINAGKVKTEGAPRVAVPAPVRIAPAVQQAVSAPVAVGPSSSEMRAAIRAGIAEAMAGWTVVADPTGVSRMVKRESEQQGARIMAVR